MHYLKLKCHRVCWLRSLVDLTFGKIHAELSILRPAVSAFNETKGGGGCSANMVFVWVIYGGWGAESRTEKPAMSWFMKRSLSRGHLARGWPCLRLLAATKLYFLQISFLCLVAPLSPFPFPSAFGKTCSLQGEEGGLSTADRRIPTKSVSFFLSRSHFFLSREKLNQKKKITPHEGVSDSVSVYLAARIWVFGKRP